eukprot:TRINITY_DN44646_c0_g1_i1.p1 TRINITY_DN44646_c0_g1~~TRINITY_DN44646_c0_g1_i1.p1  ORF type:complete len:486 (+),score=107.76 TRINITY_DN44646_c0_g1_i1:158-1615(+)
MEARRRTLTEEMVFMRTKCNRMDLIKNLNLWGNDLHNINVLRFMPNLEVLSLSVNSVSTLVDLRNLSRLSELYLRKNHICDLAEVLHLINLPQLRVLWMNDNPCATLPHYREYVLHHLPRLVKLDSQEVTEEERRRAAHMDMGEMETCVEVDYQEVLDPPDRSPDPSPESAGGSVTAAADFFGGGRQPARAAPAPRPVEAAAYGHGQSDGGPVSRRLSAQSIARDDEENMVYDRRQQPGANAAAVRNGRPLASPSPESSPYSSHVSQYPAPDQRPLPGRRDLPQMPGGERIARSQMPVQQQHSFNMSYEGQSPELTPRSDVPDYTPQAASFQDQRLASHQSVNGDKYLSRDQHLMQQQQQPLQRRQGWTHAGWDEREVDSPDRLPNGADSAGGGAMGSHMADMRHLQQMPQQQQQRLFSGMPDPRSELPGVARRPQYGMASSAEFGERSARADNILCAVLALIKELDRQGLELVRRAIEQRQGEL